jgi:hypothetical protein
LSWEEDAAFRRLLDTYYTTEKPIPADLRQACRLVLAQTESQREAVRVVLEEFFDLTESGWVNKRADNEIASMKEKQEKQRDKANKRWKGAAAVPQQGVIDAAASVIDADAVPPTPTPTPTPTPNKPPTPKGAVDNGFANFWNPYPRKTAKVQAQKAWAKLNPSEALQAEILAALAAQCKSEQWTKDGGSFIPHASTWLNQRRWEDQLPTGTAAPKTDIWAGAV